MLRASLVMVAVVLSVHGSARSSWAHKVGDKIVTTVKAPI